MEEKKYLDIIGLGIFKALNDKRYPILVNGKISESAIPTSITNSITSILSLIPDAASSENKLADKNFVNSSIATNTATFRGTFDDLATLQATSADINDYAFYVHTDEIGNTAYDRYKHNGSAWVFEYTLNNSSFTAEQWSAINSGITTTKVGNYDAHLINYSNPHKVTKSQVGLGNVENVALSSWAGSNKITTLGTITTGVWNGSKIGNDYLANSSITIGTTAISLGSTAQSLAGIEKLQLNDANSNLVYDSTTGSWKLTGNLLVTGFISAGAKGNSSSGGGSTYTQKEWAEIKIMSASEIGLLASAYSVKEAYNELNTAIETLAGKATNVTFSQTLTSGKQIGSISIDGKSTSLFAPANYAWSEVTGKPTFATVATSGSYSDLSNKPTIASLMGSTAIGGTSSYLYWNGSAWATKALGSNAFTSISKVSQLTNDSGYITGITKAMVEGVLTGNITSHTHSYLPLAGGTMANTNLVTNLNADMLDGYQAAQVLTSHSSTTVDLNEISVPSIYRISTENPNLPSSIFDYGNLLTVRYVNSDTAWQLLGAYSSDNLWFRRGSWRADGTGTLRTNAWKAIAFTDSNVASASKWATARTITLTGSVTGSVSIDGSQNVSLATTTNHTHTFDSLTSKPTTISGYGITDAYTASTIDSKLSGYLPLSGGTISVTTDEGIRINRTNGTRSVLSFMVDGGYKGGLGIGTDGVPFYRTYVGGIHTLIHSGNYNSYAPKLDGTGATGTWGINIQGFAFSAYALKRLVLPTSGTSDGPSLIYTGGQYTIGTGEGNAYEGVSTDYNLWSYPKNATAVSSTAANIQTLRLSWDKTKYWHDIFLSPNNSALWHRSVSNGSTTDWYRIVEERTNTTWGISISGNAATATNADTLDGVHFQNILERETSGFARGTDVGWYRIAETYQNNSDSYCFLLGIQRSYGNTNNETYLFSICISYRGRISITQLSGSANVRLIDKIRIDWGRNAYYIDLYINTATDGNTYRWYTVGAAKSYTAWTANPTLNGTAYEFTTVNGCKSDLGFTGNIAGNATSATQLQTSRTIWGQSFNGTGNVSGGLLDINSQEFIYSSGTWTRVGNGTAKAGLPTYIDGSTIYFRYGNTLSTGIILNSSGNVGIGTNSPSYKLHIVGVAYASEGLVSDGYISAAATSTSSDIRLKDNISEISSEMALKWLSMLKPKSWTWNSLAGVKGQSMGFVAQDVEGVLPQMIRKRRDNDYLSLDYTQLHALEVSALQSHEKRIEELERENKILKEELNKLKLNAN